MWELFNEIDNAMYGQAPERYPDRVVVEWHAEMSAYLKAIDPYGRLVTTSISHRDVAGLNQVASIPLLTTLVGSSALGTHPSVGRAWGYPSAAAVQSIAGGWAIVSVVVFQYGK